MTAAEDGPARAFLETRARGPAGALIIAIAGLVTALVAWMAWATVEEVVRAQGRVEPTGQVKLVGHPHGGMVAELLVKDGAAVAAGAPLLRLDAAVLDAERAETTARLQLTAAAAARLTAEARGVPLPLDPALAAARPDLASAQARLAAARAAALDARRTTLAQAADRARGELLAARAERARVQSGQGHVEAQLTAMRELAERGLYPRLRLAAAEKQLADVRGERQKAEAGIATAEAALAEATARLLGLDQDWRRDVLAELADAQAELERLTERLAGTTARLDVLEVRAPVAGTVVDLAVTGPGQAVPANETLLRLVPTGAALTVAAAVRNEDIGRIHPGMAATVKVLAFDWMRFGALTGTVTRIAPDATKDPTTQELRYLVAVTPSAAALGEHALAPGMLVDVELHVGERTILSYLTERIWRVRERAFREG